MATICGIMRIAREIPPRHHRVPNWLVNAMFAGYLHVEFPATAAADGDGGYDKIGIGQNFSPVDRRHDRKM